MVFFIDEEKLKKDLLKVLKKHSQIGKVEWIDWAVDVNDCNLKSIITVLRDIEFGMIDDLIDMKGSNDEPDDD